MNRNTSAWAAAHAPAGTRWGKKALSLLLGLVLCLLLLPGAALAANDSSTEEKPTLEVTLTAKVWRTVKDETTGQATGKKYRIKGVPCSDDTIPETDTIENVMVGDEIEYTITVTNNTGKDISWDDLFTINGTFNGTGTLKRGADRLTKDENGAYTISNFCLENRPLKAGETTVLRTLDYRVQYEDTELSNAALTNEVTVKVTVSNSSYSGTDKVETLVNREKFNLEVSKQWDKVKTASRPDVEVQLYANGEPVDNVDPITIQTENWFGSANGVFENVPLSDFEKYSVREVAIKDATLKETDVSVDIGMGKKLYDVFVTNDKTAKWYATYSDELDDDGCYDIYNTYIQNQIEVTKEVTKIVRNGTVLTDKTTARTGDTITYTITIVNNTDSPIDGVTVSDVFDTRYIGQDGALTFDKGNTIDLSSGSKAENVTLPVGKTELKATYTVQKDDGVYNDEAGTYYLTNTVTVTRGDETYTDAVRTEIESYLVYVPIIKTLKNEGTEALEFEDPEDFRFEIEILNAKGERVPRTTGQIEFSEVAAGVSETKKNYDSAKKTVETTLPLMLEAYNGLPAENGVKYIWIHEVTDNPIDKVTFDDSEYKLYLVPEKAGSRILYAVADPNWNGDMDSLYDHAARFTNYYDKQERKTDTDTNTVKVGPQLNRDDHTAYIMGYPDGTVRPEGQITRAEACTIFFRLLTDESRDDYFAKSNDYTDVNAGDWYNNAISTLSNAGIVTGYSDGTFRPDQPITRGEMAKIIANFANLGKGAAAFSDLSGHWSKNYVELAAGNGWITGYPDGTFRPDQQITRAETVTMINRVLERVPAKESKLLSRSVMLTFPDNTPGDWYYIAMQEASNSHAYQRSVYETDGDEMWTKLIDNVDWTKLEK